MRYVISHMGQTYHYEAPEAAGRKKVIHSAWVLSLLLFLCLTGMGCQSSSSSSNRNSTKSANPITRLYVMSLPMGLDLDQVPGTDGFAMKVYASTTEKPKSQPVLEGTIDILMFEGTIKNAASTNLAPRMIWSFGHEELVPLRVESAIGTAYNFTINWKETPPQTSKISVVARYRLPPNRDIYSSATTIAVGGQ